MTRPVDILAGFEDVMSREELMLQIARALFSDDDCGPGPTYRQQWNNPPTEEELDAWVRVGDAALWEEG